MILDNHFLNNADIPAIKSSMEHNLAKWGVPINTRIAAITNPTPEASKCLSTKYDDMNPIKAPTIANIAKNEFPWAPPLSISNMKDPDVKHKNEPKTPHICSNNRDIVLILFMLQYLFTILFNIFVKKFSAYARGDGSKL